MKSLFIPHGGGPMPLYNPESHKEMNQFLTEYGKKNRPDYIVIISGHYTTNEIEVLTNEHQTLVYDYSGFPEETYRYEYKSPVDQNLGNQLVDGLNANGINSVLNNQRGFDHGVFVPLMLLYPDHDIPVIQISLKRGYNPIFHIELGKQLRKILTGDGLILGSGFSFHNLQTFFSTEVDFKNDQFHEELVQLLKQEDPSITEQGLVDWKNLSYATYAHPSSDHFIPLLVCFGMGYQQGEILFDASILNKRAIAVQWSIDQ